MVTNLESNSIDTIPKTSPGLLTASRFLVALGLAIWLGGIIFLGAVAAPLVFKICRANGSEILAPQIVGAMVTRFNIVLYICGALLLVGWGGEKLTQPTMRGRARQLWTGQGACSVLMLAIALYGGLILMPRLNELQAQLLPQWKYAGGTNPAVGLSVTAPGIDPVLKATFDAGHHQYQNLTMIGWWLGVVALLLLCWRSALKTETASAEELNTVNLGRKSEERTLLRSNGSAR